MEIVLARGGPVAADDRGLAYGDGLFETLRVTAGRPELLARHRQRMLSGAGRLGIPMVPEAFDQAVALGLADMDTTDGVLKVLLTRGSGGRGYQPPDNPKPRLRVSVHPLPPLPDRRGASVRVAVSSIPLTVNPVLAGLKSLNRLEQVMASRVRPPECYESLMLNHSGQLTEGTRCNLLYLWDDQWCTPPRSGLAVDGVMLGAVMDWLATQGQPVAEQPLWPEMVHNERFGGLLLLNSVIRALAVSAIDEHELPARDRLATIIRLTDLPLEEF